MDIQGLTGNQREKKTTAKIGVRLGGRKKRYE